MPLHRTKEQDSRKYVSKDWYGFVVIFGVFVVLIWLGAIALMMYLYFGYYSFTGANHDTLLDWLKGCSVLAIIALVITAFYIGFSLMGVLLWSHVVIGEDRISSVICGRNACVVDRNKAIYYATCEHIVSITTAEQILIISNTPFKLTKWRPPFLMRIYDPKKEIAIPNDDETRRIICDKAVYVGKQDITIAAALSNVKKKS